MTKEKAIEIVKKALESKKGSFQSFEYETSIKPLVKFKENTIKKHTKMVARFGISYGNMASHKEKIVGSLPWGQWVAGYENYLIEHKGNYYLRFYTSAVEKMQVEYTLNGKETTKQWLQDNGYISSATKQESDTFAINLDNIIQIGA